MIGVNPVEDVEKTNIPVMMVHGDVDRRVEVYHMDDFKAAMEKAGKIGPKVYVLANEQDQRGTEAGSGSGDDAPEASTGTRAGQTNYQPQHRFVTLEGADHFYVTLMYNHQEKLYKEMLDFLANDCGPGGL